MVPAARSLLGEHRILWDRLSHHSDPDQEDNKSDGRMTWEPLVTYEVKGQILHKGTNYEF